MEGKTLKEKLFNLLDTQGYATDSDVAKIWRKEPNWATIEEYKRQWKSLQKDREFFDTENITAIEKYRGHKAKVNGYWYRISKLFFEELKPKFIRDYTRADLKEVELYKKDTSRIL